MTKPAALLVALALVGCATPPPPPPASPPPSGPPPGAEPITTPDGARLYWDYEAGGEPKLDLLDWSSGEVRLSLRCDALSGRMLLIAPVWTTRFDTRRAAEDGAPLVMEFGARFEGPTRWMVMVDAAWPGTRFDPTTAQLDALARAETVSVRLGQQVRRAPAPREAARHDFAWKCADALRMRRPSVAPRPG